MSTPYDIKQVIVYRRDLNMRKGKIAAQVAHASMKVFFDRREPGGEYLQEHHNGGLSDVSFEDYLLVPLTPEMWEWVDGSFAKVVLTVESEEDLLRVYTLALEAGLPAALITDAGNTEFHGVPTNTAVAIGPARREVIDPITGPEGAVQTKLP